MSHVGVSGNVQPSPNVFKPTMNTLIDDFNSPSNRISGDMNRSPVVDSLHRITELFRLSRFDLVLVLLNIR